jgi:hypothetical protein
VTAATLSVQTVRRISFSERRIDQAIGRLQLELRALYRKFAARQLQLNTAKEQGLEVIEQTYIELSLNIETYLKSKQVHEVNKPFDPSSIQAAFVEAQTRWNQILTDHTNQASVTAAGTCGSCSCQEHQVLSAASTPYWFTPQGLLRRILGLSQDFVYRILNLSLQIAALQNDAYGLQWIMHQDDRLCPICLRYGTGGDHGFYRLNWFQPDPPPVHPGCRCTYQLIIKK